MNVQLRVRMLAGVAVALTGCYRPDLASCAVTCVAGGTCPSGLERASDGFCHVAGDDRMCGDAGTPDAGLDGSPLPDAAPLDAAPPSFDYTSIAAGHRHACATPTITRVGAFEGWLQVAADEQHTCAIRDDGAGRRISCWGADGSGQLGDSVGISSGHLPRELGLIGGGGAFTDWAEVTAGGAHTCARRDTGATYCWGEGGHGEVGPNDLADSAVPIAVVSAVGFTQLSAGVNFTCGIGDDANLYCWGENSIGPLGRAQGGNSAAPERVGLETGWTAVSTGFYGVCGLRAGQVYCWGAGSFGEIGDGAWAYRYEPTLAPIDDAVETTPPPRPARRPRSARSPPGPRSASARSTAAASPPATCTAGAATTTPSSATRRCGRTPTPRSS